MLAFVFRLVYQLFCKRYFAALRKYRLLSGRWGLMSDGPAQV